MGNVPRSGTLRDLEQCSQKRLTCIICSKKINRRIGCVHIRWCRDTVPSWLWHSMGLHWFFCILIWFSKIFFSLLIWKSPLSVFSNSGDRYNVNFGNLYTNQRYGRTLLDVLSSDLLGIVITMTPPIIHQLWQSLRPIKDHRLVLDILSHLLRSTPLCSLTWVHSLLT